MDLLCSQQETTLLIIIKFGNPTSEHRRLRLLPFCLTSKQTAVFLDPQCATMKYVMKLSDSIGIAHNFDDGIAEITV